MWKTEFIITLIVFNLFFIAFIVCIIIYIKQYITKKKEHIMHLNSQYEEHQKEILSTQIEIQNQTMQYIGREIHDNIGQQLTLASLYMQQLARKNKATPIGDTIVDINLIINKSLKDLRSLSKTLTDDSIKNNDIIYLLQQECNTISTINDIKIIFNTNKENADVSYEIKTVLVRILQEFIQNSIKHSACNTVTILLEVSNNEIVFKLKDDGLGFDTTDINFKGIGLKNIKKRIEIVKGTINIQSILNFGTSFIIKIPN